jgi:hypothetical protein
MLGVIHENDCSEIHNGRLVLKSAAFGDFAVGFERNGGCLNDELGVGDRMGPEKLSCGGVEDAPGM